MSQDFSTYASPLSIIVHAPYLFGVNFEATELDACTCS